MKQDIPWKRFAVEAVLIVGSILLAFAINAWWEEENQLNDARAILEALQGDLETQQPVFRAYERFNQGIEDASLSLLEAMATDHNATSNERIEKLIQDIIWHSNPSWWESAALDAALSDGALKLISSTDLVSHLLELQDQLNLLKDYSRNDTAFYYNELTPFLRENSSLLAMAPPEHAPGLPNQTLDFPDFSASFEFDHKQLLSNIEFQNLIAERLITTNDITDGALVGLNEQIDIVLRLLEAELQ